jgi:cobaltochelatase CobT
MKMTKQVVIPPSDPLLDKPSVRAAEFEDGTAKTVRTIGKNAGLNVVFAGDKAKTDGSVVVLPKQHDDKLLTRRQVKVGRGYADHETMHHLITDLPTFGQALGEMEHHKQHLMRRFTQAVEDVRIEGAAIKLYPGMKESLADVADHAARHFLETHYQSKPECVEDFKAIGPIATTWAARKQLGYGSPMIDQCLDVLPDEVRKKAEQWAAMSLGVENGAEGPGTVDKQKAHQGCLDGMALAARLAAEAEQEPEPEGKPSEGDGPGKKGDGEDGKGQGKGNPGPQGQPGGGGGAGEAGDDGDEGGGSAGEAGDGEEEAPKRSAGGNHGGGPASSSEMEPIDPDLDASVQEFLAEDFNKSQGGMGQYRTFSTAEDGLLLPGKVLECSTGARFPYPKMNQVDGKERYARSVRGMGSKIGGMTRKLERALAAKARVDWEGGKRRGKLDRRNLTKVMDGSRNVFRQRMDTEAIDTAVHLLVDLSGSMQNRVMLAQETCIMLAEAMDRCGIPIEVSGFRDFDFSREMKMALPVGAYAAGNFIRSEAVRLIVFKTMEERLQRARARMGNICTQVDGSTPDGPAILLAWDSLKKSGAKRKVLMTMTDGGSGWTTRGDGRCYEYTRDAIQKVTDEGGEVLGIGIQSGHGASMYPKWVTVNDIKDLSGNVISMMAKALVDDGFVADNAALIAASSRDVRRSA